MLESGAPGARGPGPVRLGRYEIAAVIGSGMMGVVYKAWDPLLGRPVALKVLRKDVPLSEDEQLLTEQRFLREASLAATLCHPNIVVVHDYGRDEETGAPFIAFEYLEGHTLDGRGTGALLPWREALRLTGRLAHALHHAHGHGTIHRDIKPSNVMVLASGEPKILDFGIARPSAGQLSAVGESWGTPAYMSPEQAMAGHVDGRSDLFSLGSMLYELLAGRRAFGSDGVIQIMSRVLHEEPAAPTCTNPELPPGVDTILARALAKDPGQRYPDGLAFAEDVEDVLAGRPVRDRPGLRDAVATVALEAPGPATRPGGRAGHRPSAGRLRVWAPGVVLGAGLALAVTQGRVAWAPVAAPLPAAAPPPASVPLETVRQAESVLRPPTVAAHPTTSPRVEAAEDEGQGLTAKPRPVLPQRALPVPARSAGEPVEVLPHRQVVLPAPANGPADVVPGPLLRPALVALSVRHGLERGQLKVWVDDSLVLDTALASAPARKLLFLKRRVGRLAEVLEVPPGERRLRFEVVADGVTRSGELRGLLRSDQTRVLEVKLGGRVELKWKS